MVKILRLYSILTCATKPGPLLKSIMTRARLNTRTAYTVYSRMTAIGNADLRSDSQYKCIGKTNWGDKEKA